MRHGFLVGRAAQISDPVARHLWAEAALAFLMIFGCAIVAEWLLRSIMARLMPRLPSRRSDTPLVRAAFAILGLVLGLLPIFVFAAIAYGGLSIALDPYTRTRTTLTVLVNATVEARLLLCVVRSLLLPADAGTVFLPITGETRNYLYIWVRRFTFWAIFGYAVAPSRLVARRSRGALRADAEGGGIGARRPRHHLRAAKPRIDRRLDRRRAGRQLRLGPRSPHPRRDLASPRDPLHYRGLPDLRAAHRGRVRLRAARHRAEPRHHRRRAAFRWFCPEIELPRLCRQTGTEGAVPDPRAARQPLYSDLDRNEHRHRLYPRRAGRAAGLEHRRLRLVRLRSRSANDGQRAVDRRGADHRARAVGDLRQRDRAAP